MKAKVTAGSSFEKLEKYMNKTDSTFISSSAGTSADFLKSTNRLVQIRPDCQKPALHFSLSQPPGEPLNPEIWEEITTEFLQEMGLSENEFLAVRHGDADHDHVHIAVSKIDASGKLWNDSFSARKAHTACEKIEKKFNLTVTKTVEQFRSETGQNRHRIKDGELRQLARTGTPGERRKAAITEKMRLKNESKKRDYAKNGIDSPARIDERGIHPKTEKSNRGSNSGEKFGNRRTQNGIRSFANKSDEVVFTQNSQIIAKINHARDSIEVFSLDEKAIDFAILHAQKSGQIPLQIYGSDEFIALAKERAAELKVPCFIKKCCSENQQLTPHQLNESEQKMRNPVPIDPVLDRLQHQLDLTDLAVASGNIRPTEKDWRYPLKLKNWIEIEMRTDRTKTVDSLLNLAQEDRRISREMASEFLKDRAETDAEERSESSQHQRMRG